MKKYKDRYVLGVGYPVTPDLTKRITSIGLVRNPEHIWEEDGISLKIPEHLVSDTTTPKYRLVLEKMPPRR